MSPQHRRPVIANCVGLRYYNCIGAFTVPDRKDIPDVDVLMETRKGVAVSYVPAMIA